MFSPTGVDHGAEPQSSIVRADLVAWITTAVWIFECKRSTKAKTVPAAEVLAQIRARSYAAPYHNQGKRIFLIGLAFSNATHELIDSAWEEA